MNKQQAKLSLLVQRWRKGANSNRLVVQAAERGQSSAGPPYVGECRLRAEILGAHAADVEEAIGATSVDVLATIDGLAGLLEERSCYAERHNPTGEVAIALASAKRLLGVT